MTRRLRIVIGSAVILVGLLLIIVLSFVGVTHTGFGRDRVRSMVMSMLEGKVKGRVYIGHISGGFFSTVTIDSVEIRDDQDSVFFASSNTIRATCSIGASFSASSRRIIRSCISGSTRTASGTGGASFRRA
jgi:autotransporter translocation and assembly factor TamB